MSGLKILQEDLKKNKETTTISKDLPIKPQKEPRKEEKEQKNISGDITISYTLNPKNGKYTFLYSINNKVVETIITESLSEGLDYIFKMAKENALRLSQTDSKTQPNPAKQNHNTSKIGSLF